jgi:RNA polymerase sigma-70 factor (ECF subfamily)
MSDFDDAYAKHADAVFRYALRLVGRRDVAEDITSETFLTLHRNSLGVDFTQLPGWLFTVARNKARDHWRRAKVEERYLNTLEPAATSWSPPLEMWLSETKALKPIHRACLILRYVHDMTRVEIAERLGLSEVQVKGHLQYARTILRAALEKEPR